MSQLGKTVRLLRKGKGLSLQGLAEASGRRKSYIWDIEQGRTDNPTVALLSDLAGALGVAPGTLFQAALEP